jgi:cyclopropane fatty-acyl-phospholipid synthase-like methyltransferase
MSNVIGNQFRKPSGIWGRVVSFLMKKGNRHAYDKLIPQLKVKNGDRILEIGYGHGIGIDMLCSRFDCRVTGIDFSELMFKEARKRNGKHCADGTAILHCGDYLDFTGAGGEFDWVIFINVIYFWRDLADPLGKVYGELRPGGTVCFFMAHRDDLNRLKFTTDDVFNKYTIEQVIEVMQRAGFKEISYNFDKGYIVTARR